MEILGKLLGTIGRVKIMKLFLFNPELAFDIDDISRRAKVPLGSTRKEVALLESIGLVRRKTFLKTFERQSGKTVKKTKKRVMGFELDQDFKYLQPLHYLLLDTDSLKPDEIMRHLTKAGKIKMAVVSGVFLQNWDSRLDMLIVGDKLKLGLLDSAIKHVESEIGKELRYAVFDTPDFLYRLSVYDKLVRDVFDYPHRKLFDRLNVVE